MQRRSFPAKPQETNAGCPGSPAGKEGRATHKQAPATCACNPPGYRPEAIHGPPPHSPLPCPGLSSASLHEADSLDATRRVLTPSSHAPPSAQTPGRASSFTTSLALCLMALSAYAHRFRHATFHLPSPFDVMIGHATTSQSPWTVELARSRPKHVKTPATATVNAVCRVHEHRGHDLGTSPLIKCK